MRCCDGEAIVGNNKDDDVDNDDNNNNNNHFPVTSTTTSSGDPYEFQIRSNFDVARAHFLSLGYANVSIAFQNHGGKGTIYILKLSL